MQGQDTGNVVVDLINVYTSATSEAAEAAQRSHDPQLPMRERLAYRRRALQCQELADQALRMIHELTARAAA